MSSACLHLNSLLFYIERQRWEFSYNRGFPPDDPRNREEGWDDYREPLYDHVEDPRDQRPPSGPTPDENEHPSRGVIIIRYGED